MSKFRLSCSYSGIGELLKSSDVSDHIRSICTALNPDTSLYAVSVMAGRKRINGRIYATGEEGVNDNLDNNTLAIAIGGGR